MKYKNEKDILFNLSKLLQSAYVKNNSVIEWGKWKRGVVYKFCAIVFISCLLIIGNRRIAAGAEFTDFGPYWGKIVDAETKEPIEGVVVFIEWVKLHAFGGSTFIDAQETLTDKYGEFYISGIWVFNPWKQLTSEAIMTIYKSGYQAITTGAWKNWNIFRPKLEYVLNVEDGKPIFLLKKLTNIEERKKYSGPSVSYKVSCEKWKLLREEINKENRFRGVDEEYCND